MSALDQLLSIFRERIDKEAGQSHSTLKERIGKEDNHVIDDINRLIPSLIEEVRPDESISFRCKIFGVTEITLLHILTIHPKINYHLLFDQKSESVNYNSVDSCSATPLYYACNYKNASAMKLLLEHGASPNIHSFMRPVQVEQLILQPIDKESIEILKLLLEYRADVNASLSACPYLPSLLYMFVSHPCNNDCTLLSEYKIEFLKVLVNGNTSVNLLDYRKQSALHIVCKYHNMEFAKILLDAGCNYNQKDWIEKLPMDEITNDTVKERFLEMIESLNIR